MGFIFVSMKILGLTNCKTLDFDIFKYKSFLVIYMTRNVKPES